MYVVTVEILRLGQERHAHLHSYRANLKNVCILYVRSADRSLRGNLKNICILYVRSADRS